MSAKAAAKAGSARRSFSHEPSTLATLPAGCLVAFGALTLILLVLGIVVLSVAFPGYRSSATYKEAMAIVRAEPSVRAALGEPVRETGIVSFVTDLQPEGGGTKRFVSVRVEGPNGEGILYAEGVERSGVRLTEVRLTLTNGTRLRLTPLRP